MPPQPDWRISKDCSMMLGIHFISSANADTTKPQVRTANALKNRYEDETGDQVIFFVLMYPAFHK